MQLVRRPFAFLLAIAWLLWLASFPAHAQDMEVVPHVPDSPLDRPLSELHHRAYTDERDAPSTFIGATQTADGFLWFGSSKGLVRFDGVRFDNVLGHLPSLRIKALYGDGQGGLWIGYKMGGLTYARDGKLTHYQGGKEIPDGTLFAILPGPDGHLWIATTKGVARQSGNRWEPVGAAMGYDGTQPEGMRMIDGTLWIVDVAGAWLLDRGATRFRRMDREAALVAMWSRLGDPPRLYNASTDGAAMADSSGALWLSVSEGLERHRWLVDADGRKRHVTEHFTRADGLSSDEVMDFFEDREHNIWVLTSGGLDQFRASKLRPVAFPGHFSNPALVEGGDGSVWVGNTWMPPFALGGEAPVPKPGLPDAVITAMRDRHGTLWMGGYRGLAAYRDGETQAIALPSALKDIGNRFQALALDEDDALWVSASGYGLYRYAHGQWSRKDGSDGFPEGPPLRMLDDGQGRLWLAYPHDVLIVRSRQGIRRYDAENGLQAGGLTAVQVRGAHVWIGGDNGLFALRGDRFVPMLGEGGERFRGISGIVETAQGELWLNAFDGAYRLKGSDLARALQDDTYRLPFLRFGADDGRLGVPASIRPLPTLLQSADGRLWFATNSTVSWLDPARILENRVPPAVSIDAVHAGDRRYPSGAAIELPPLTRRLELDYTAASMTQPQRVRFRYRLDGVDEDWQDAGDSRRASYTNLSPGAYRFRVQAFNEDGVPSQGDAHIDFVIAPAWHQSAWFRLVCLALFMALIWLAFLLRARYVHARTWAAIEARHGERERIARELHDTLLQGIQGLLLRVQAWAADASLSATRRQEMETAADRARDILGEGRDRIMILRHGAIVEGSLADALRETGEEGAATYGVPFALTERGKPRELDADVVAQSVEIAREAMRNAFVHASARHVTVTILHTWLCLRVTVSDDGQGIDSALLHAGGREGHWGMDGMRERAYCIGARLRWRSHRGKGTDVRLIVPRWAHRPLHRKGRER
jgi:signal transduction histidine kinase/ligand-binding sensor domain-containing protein